MGTGKPRKSIRKPEVDQSQAAERLCIKCQKLFKSTGPANRYCRACREKIKDARQRPFQETDDKLYRQLVGAVNEEYSLELANRFIGLRWLERERRIKRNAEVLRLPLYVVLPEFAEEVKAMAMVKLPKLRNPERIKSDYQAVVAALRNYAGLLIDAEIIEAVMADVGKSLHTDVKLLRQVLAGCPLLTPTGIRQSAWRIAGNLEEIKQQRAPGIWNAGTAYEGWASAEITAVTRCEDAGRLTVWMKVLSGPFAGHGLSREITGSAGSRMLRMAGIPAKKEVPFEYLGGMYLMTLLVAREGDDRPSPMRWKGTTAQTAANLAVMARREHRTEESCRHFGTETRCRDCLCGREARTILDMPMVCPAAIQLFPRAENANN